MATTTVHIINHTHWDREWFLTSVYTSGWIPGLIDKVEQLVADNPNYHFLLDGQTLVIEDLVAVAPQYAPRAEALIRAGNLIIGPYYCQPDWQLTGGELLIRNLLYGRQDGQRYGGAANTGWLVDTFGHISQAPQIHQLFGIDTVYVWRGVPQLTPYFWWQGADGSRLLTINLFGGYRNLYGVSHAPEVARARLYAEVEKLRPYYPTGDIPLFDGYDLEDDPEDPLRFYQGQGEMTPALRLRETTPAAFAREIGPRLRAAASGGQASLPVIAGELNSGKYGATFPGALSARTYLKIMACDCEQMLFKICEPLAALASLKGRASVDGSVAARYERWARLLLQNAVHDCLCGVSIDQVHEKMEDNYRRAFAEMQADVETSLAFILRDFAPGSYAVSTNPFTADNWQLAGAALVHVQTEGIGVWPVVQQIAMTPEQPRGSDEAVRDTFTWRNEHYEAVVGTDGVVQVGEGRFGVLLVSAEQGDTYSEEAGERLGEIQPLSPPVIVQKSEQHCLLVFRGAWRQGNKEATATVRLHFDQSPLLRWQIDLDSRGADLRIEMVFETGRQAEIMAGMPFDVTPRSVADTDLLPRALPAALANVLLGQRELNVVSTFPFHDFVAVTLASEGNAGAGPTVAVLARGLHSYTAGDGAVTLLLQRAVQWLTRAELGNRVGDAGPFFYVPDARCERTVRHEVAVAVGPFAPDSMALQRLNAAFQNPALIVTVQRNDAHVVPGKGGSRSWGLLQEDVPLGSLHMRQGQLLARFYNPTPHSQPLSHVYQATDIWGAPVTEIDVVAAKKIVTVCLPYKLPPLAGRPGDGGPVAVQWLAPPRWRVGDNSGLPDTAVIRQLEEKIMLLEARLAETAVAIKQSEAATKRPDLAGARLRLQHQYYVIGRELLECRLSVLLNRRKLEQQGAAEPARRYAYLYERDEEIAAVGLELNWMRIKRRIFDYVVAALPQ